MSPAELAALRGGFAAFGRANPTLDVAPLIALVDQLSPPPVRALGSPVVVRPPSPRPAGDRAARSSAHAR